MNSFSLCASCFDTGYWHQYWKLFPNLFVLCILFDLPLKLHRVSLSFELIFDGLLFEMDFMQHSLSNLIFLSFFQQHFLLVLELLSCHHFIIERLISWPIVLVQNFLEVIQIKSMDNLIVKIDETKGCVLYCKKIRKVWFLESRKKKNHCKYNIPRSRYLLTGGSWFVF